MKRNKKHLDRVAALGCIVCKGRAEIHHIRNGYGMGQRAPDEETIPLCPRCHRTGGYGVAIHAGKKAFEEKHGTERELLEEVRRRLDCGY